MKFFLKTKKAQAMHETWSGVPLEPTYAFGLRVYRRGNVLLRHVDRIETHIISGIMHVDRQVDEPWPIHIINNTGHEHAVDLKPGQMLFYESARLAHHRPTPLKGDWYASLFVHFRPVGWPLKHDDILAQLPRGWDRDTTATRPEPVPAHEEL